MDIKQLLFNLSDKVSIGNISCAADTAAEYLSDYCDVKRLDCQTVVGTVKGDSDYTIMLDAHIDEVGMIVTNVAEDGFLTVAKCGGIDLRHLPSKSVIIHGKKDITGVFCSTPPHLSKGEEEFSDIAKIKIDTGLGSAVRDIVSVGDFVTYNAKAQSLMGDRVCGKSFDDRSGVVCLLELARRLKGKKLPCNVVFLLSNAEELGLRGAKTAAFTVEPNESVAIDVSFGDGPDVPADLCGKLGVGAMIGMSPVLYKNISKKLIDLAEKNNIPYQTEVMGETTSTNADVISVSKNGVKCGLVSIPLRNMHTDVEVLDICDIKSVCDLLEQYILSGGVMND